MLARHALTRHWWIADEDIDLVPERYREWHRSRLRQIRETPKRLAFDEFHRTGAAPAVRSQVERDAREARKHGVRLCLASQRLDDFGDALVELANRIWVLGAGGKAGEMESLARVFELSETVTEAVRFRLAGPGPGGAPALLIAADARGRFEQVAVNAPGPVELWALTTSPRDAALRERFARPSRAGGSARGAGPALPRGIGRRVDRGRAAPAGAARRQGRGVRERSTGEARRRAGTGRRNTESRRARGSGGGGMSCMKTVTIMKRRPERC